MAELALAAVFLPLSHFGISSTALRGWLVSRIGRRAYLILYSAVSLAALFWLVHSYRRAETEYLWMAPAPLLWLAVVLTFVGVVLLVIGLSTPNPTIVGADSLFDRPDVVRGVLRVTRNPFLWGVALWAIAHVLVGGDAASVLLFASVGSLALVGAPLLDAKKARQQPERWKRFAAVTSSVPFLAIAQGRQRLVMSEIGLWRLALGVGASVLLLLAHRSLFGVAPLGRLR